MLHEISGEKLFLTGGDGSQTWKDGQEKLPKTALKYNLFGLLALLVVYVLVQSLLHCGKLVCERMEGGMAQAEARIMMLNALGNVEGKNGRRSWINDHIGL